MTSSYNQNVVNFPLKNLKEEILRQLQDEQVLEEAITLKEVKLRPRWVKFRKEMRKRVFGKTGYSGQLEYYWVSDDGRARRQTEIGLKRKLNVLAENVGFPVTAVSMKWIKWEMRIIDGEEYKPSEDLIFYDDDAKIWMLNTWVASKYKKTKLAKVRPAILDKMLGIFIPRKEERDFFISWIAHIVCNPTNRHQVAVFLRTEQEGLGKDVFLDYCIKPLLGQHNYRRCKLGVLKRQFNADVFRSTLLHVTETKDAKEDVVEHLKNMITDSSIRLELKKENIDIETPVYSNFIFSSNHERPLVVGQNNRRFYFMEMPREYSDAELLKFDRFWGETIAELKKGLHLQEIRNYFQWVYENTPEEHLAGFQRAIMTDAKMAILSENAKEEKANTLEIWLHPKRQDYVFQIDNIRSSHVGRYMTEGEVKKVLLKMGFVKTKRRVKHHRNPINVWQHPSNHKRGCSLWTGDGILNA